MYKGVTTFGLGDYCGVFSETEQFGDGFSRGIQHLFYKDYTKDLLRMAVTINRTDDESIEYADITYNGRTAPEIIPVIEEGTDEFFDVFTKYRPRNGIERSSKAYALPSGIVMEEELINISSRPQVIMQYAYIFFNFDKNAHVKYDKHNQCIIWQGSNKEKNLIIGLQQAVDMIYISKEAKATAISTLHKILNKSIEKNLDLEGSDGLSAALGRKVILMPDDVKVFRWYVIPCSSIQLGLDELNKIRNRDAREEAAKVHSNFFNKSGVNDFIHSNVKKAFLRNLLSIKAVNLNGMVPADILGYYFSGQGTPTSYVRDSLMVARAFLYSGYYEEAKQIIGYISILPLKKKGEFYQRYDAYGKPAEGQNNDIRHQLDSNGYFLSLIYQYYKKTGEILVGVDYIKDIISCIKENQTSRGLIGPEGGVNEGVYGAAFITSTNMFNAGGLYHIHNFLNELNIEGVQELIEEIEGIVKEIESGINSMWDSERRYYRYGYSATSESMVERYDTPQYFSVLYGYPNSEKLQQNNDFLLKNASFFGDGIGYSQQCYHHGVWFFNTSACAQYNWINDNEEEYIKKVQWMINHLNGYALAPEAISAEDEKCCFNNPLNWACAEVVATIALPRYLIDRNFKGEN